ncbi:GtrA family protein [Brachybacterium sp. DNPG3]
MSTTSPPRARFLSGAIGLLREHLGSSLKFLVVGGIVFFVDAAMYNAMVFWNPGEGWGQGILHGHPLIAKTLSIAIASCLTYLGNRLWTFSDRPAPHTGRSIAAFILVNIIATLLQLACLAFSRYVLGLDSPLADNISGTFVGQVVSTSFRYVTYGRFVFPREAPPSAPHEADDAADHSAHDAAARDAIGRAPEAVSSAER